MDVTPSSLNDSGYNSFSSSTSNGNVKRVLNFPSFSSTPSRKRKSDNRCRKLSDILEEKKQGIQSFNFNDGNESGYSSFINNSQGISFELTSTLEKCSLDEGHSPRKKSRIDEGRKSRSAPNTPQRQENTEDNCLRKFHSLDLTPTRCTNVKIGTPERNEILYPHIKIFKSPKNGIKRLKPSTKRLFHCRDFVYIFTNVEKVDHIIKQIFSYLPDVDLVNVAGVSKLWKKTLFADEEIYSRYKTHLRNINVRKENIYGLAKKNCKNVGASPLVGPLSPSRVNWSKFAITGAALDKAQRLTKCLICARPAVVERGLARCSAPSCSYIWCQGCCAGGQNPETLDCCCQTPHSPPSPLQDKSNGGGSASVPPLVSFLSSGYFCLNDDKNAKAQVLTDCNENITHQNIQNNSKPFDVLEHRDKIRKAKKTLSSRRHREPGSPQNINVSAAGSKQSKRNLRRLLF